MFKGVGSHAREALGLDGGAGTGTQEGPRRGRRGATKGGAAKGNGKARGTSAKSGATGRIDRSGQEKVIDQTALRKNLSDMLGLYGKAQQAQVALREKIKAVAEKSGYLASTVRAVVVAHSKGDEVVADKKREAEQLTLALEVASE